MRAGDRKLFAERTALYAMVNLRALGWTLDAIAGFYGCDRTSVRAQCRKYGIVPLGTAVWGIDRLSAGPLRNRPMPLAEWRVMDGQRVCMGRKSYADYLRPISPLKPGGDAA